MNLNAYVLVSPEPKNFIWVRIELINADECTETASNVRSCSFIINSETKMFCRAALAENNIICDDNLWFLSIWLDKPTNKPDDETLLKYVRHYSLLEDAKDFINKNGSIPMLGVAIDLCNPLGY